MNQVLIEILMILSALSTKLKENELPHIRADVKYQGR